MNLHAQRRCRILVVIFMALTAWSSLCTAGELVVIASTDPALKPGSKVDASHEIRVAADAEVTLIASNGQSMRLSGPFEGVLESPSGPSDPGLVDSLSRLIAVENSPSATLAVFRSGPQKLSAGRPDIWGLHIARAGRYCVRDDRPIMLWWPQSRAGARITITRVDDDAQSVSLRWPAKGKSRPWPPELPLTDGASFLARFTSRSPGIRLDVVVMPSLATDAHRTAWMADHGCTFQALRALNALREGSL